MLKKLTIKFALLCPLLSTAVQGADWQSDSSKSSLHYTASFEQAPINGIFREFSVSYTTDAQGKPTRLAVQVSITSADMGSSDINEVIRSREWFNVAKYPLADFASDKFQSTLNSKGQSNFIATGILQLKGVKRAVSVPFRWQERDDGKALMTGNLILNRTDFSIGSGEWASDEQIGVAVKVWFEVLLISSAKE